MTTGPRDLTDRSAALDSSSTTFGPYVPLLLSSWDPHPIAGGTALDRTVPGTMVSADLSGFTALSERLARVGKEGAETLTAVLNRCFDQMIAAVTSQGGDVLKFGGDALLILFDGADHVERALHAAVAMRRIVAAPISTGHGGRIHLEISQGIHTGEFQLFVSEGSHAELIVCGPDATETVECEGAATPGEILLSAASADLVDRSRTGEVRGDGRLVLVDDRMLGEEQVRLVDGVSDRDQSRFLPPGLRAQIMVGALPEHRLATIAFLRFSGIDGVIAEGGVPEIGRRLGRLASVVGDATTQFDIHWLATDVAPDGGKFILAAGAPTSSGEDEDRMVQALRAILDGVDDLELRAGVNNGHVFVGDLGSTTRRTFTVMGDAVNLAARLMAKAEIGQVVASDDVLARMRAAFHVTSLEPFMVKGKAAPIRASVLGSVAHGTSESATVGRLPLLGRDAEIAELVVAVDRAMNGEGAVVELLGDAGTGKSRLLEEARTLRPDLSAHVALCGPYAQASPYFASRILLRAATGLEIGLGAEAAGEELTAFVRSVAPDLEPWLPLLAAPFQAVVPMTEESSRIAPQFRRARSHQLAIDLLGRAVTTPTAFVVEDAHWLDDASAELIGALALETTERPWMLCLSGRTSRIALDDLERPPVVIRLASLDAAVAVELAVLATGSDEALRRADWELIADRGSGNPLFVIELARAAAAQGTSDALSGSVESVVMSRIDTLSPDDRHLLRQAAVLGSVVDLRLLGDALGGHVPTSTEDWRHLAAFVEPFGDGALRFLHSLYRQVAYEGLSYRWRRDLHRKIAEHIEREADDPADQSDLLAIHYHAAEARASAWRYSVMAGDRANAVAAVVEAARFYRWALDDGRRVRSLPKSEYAEVAESLGDVLELDGRYDEAKDAFRTARRRVGDDLTLARLMRKEGLVRERAGAFPAALRWWTRAERLLADGAHDRRLVGSERASIHLEIAGVRHRQGHFREQIAWASRAAEEAQHAGDRANLARAYYLLESGYSVLGMSEAAQYRSMSLPVYEELGDDLGRANVLNNLGVSANSDGDQEGAIAMFEESERGFERGGDVVGAATAALNRGEMLSYVGRLDDAVPVLQDAVEDDAIACYAIGMAYTQGVLGHVEALRGNTAGGLADLDAAIEHSRRIGAHGITGDMLVRRVEALVAAGRFEEAVVEADETARVIAATEPDPSLELQLAQNRAAALAALEA